MGSARRVLPTALLADPMGEFWQARHQRSPSPNKIHFGGVHLEEAPPSRQRSRSRQPELPGIVEVSDGESEVESGSEHGMRTAAQEANRGRDVAETSGSATPATDSEEESLPSDTDMIKLIEDRAAWKWRADNGVEDPSLFAHAFKDQHEAFRLPGHAVASHWLQAHDYIVMVGPMVAGTAIDVEERAKAYSRQVRQQSRRSRAAVAKSQGRRYSTKAEALYAAGKVSDRRKPEARAKSDADFMTVFGELMRDAEIYAWNDAACGTHAVEMRVSAIARRVEAAIKESSFATLNRAKQTTLELCEYWTQTCGGRPLSELREQHVEDFLHQNSEPRTGPLFPLSGRTSAC